MKHAERMYRKAMRSVHPAILSSLRPSLYSGTGVLEGQEENSAGLVTWSRKIPLITNPYLVLQCIFTPFGFAIVMGSFLSIITGGEWALHTRSSSLVPGFQC